MKNFNVLVAAYSHGVKSVRAGLSYHLLCQALALRRIAKKEGIRVYVASTAPEDAPGLWERLRNEFSRDEIYVLGNEYTAFTKAAADLLEKNQHLIVHVHGNRQLRALVGLKQRYSDRLRIVYTVHSFRNATWKRLPYCWISSREIRAYVDYVIFLSPAAMKEFVNSERLIKNGRGGLIPLGVANWAEWQNCKPNYSDLNEEFLTLVENPNLFRLIYLAAFKPGKGHRWLVEGAAPVLRRHHQTVIILAGWGQENLKAQVKLKAQEVGIASQICMPGAISRNHVPWLLKRCKAAVVPSRSETFAQAIVEPMAAGLPVIGTRKGAGSYLIMDYLTGIGVNFHDRLALGNALEYLITHPVETSQMGQNAAQIVRTLLDWDRIAESHLRIYGELF